MMGTLVKIRDNTLTIKNQQKSYCSKAQYGSITNVKLKIVWKTWNSENCQVKYGQ